MKYKEQIDKVVANLREEIRDDLAGIILGGSVAYGTPLEKSDVDIFAVIKANWHQRRSFIIDGADIELLIKPISQIKKEFLNTDLPATIAIFANGKVLYDEKGDLSELVEEAKNIWDASRPMVSPSSYPKLRHVPVDLLKDAEDMLEIDELASVFIMNNSLQAILDVYYKLECRWSVKPKYQLRDLKEYNPLMEKKVRNILDSQLSIKERCHHLSCLINEVLAPIGGRLGEWQSDKEELES